MMVLAAAPGGSLLTTRSIADAVGTPYNHVSKAMAKLRELGMIDVERGRTAVPGSAAPGAPPPWASSCGSWTPGWTWPPAWRTPGPVR
jgi:DNA-binding transcriptional MocR family regulator